MNHVLWKRFLISYYGMHQGISLENLTSQGSRDKNIQSVGRRLKCLSPEIRAIMLNVNRTH